MPVTVSDLRNLMYHRQDRYLIPRNEKGEENFQTTLVSWVPGSAAIMEFTHHDDHISLRKNGIVYLVVESDCDHHNATIHAFTREAHAADFMKKTLMRYLHEHSVQAEIDFTMQYSLYLVFGDGSWIHSDDFDPDLWTHRDPPTEVYVDMRSWDGTAEHEETLVEAAIHAFNN